MELLKSLQEIRNPVLDIIFKIFTLFGEELVITAIICILFWCISKRSAYIIAFSFFLSGLVVQGLKITFRVDRPWIKDSSIVPVDGAVKTATSYSFPSGHTQSGTALFTSVAAILRKKWALVLSSVIIAGVMISRMYLGVHTPVDVLVSFIITFLLSALVSGYYEKIENADLKVKRIITTVMIVVCITLIVYDLVLMNMGLIEYENAGDCFKAAGAGLGFSLGWYLETKYVNFSPKACWWKQIIKLVIGIAVAFVLKSAPKLISDSSFLVDVTRYFVTVLWITFLYPLIIKKLWK
ncbi:MAG: phosphatase PAP2 family protein [Lachnospiraceae bacterium]|nr:phosphatase PAP2 family protein [Lachnospiraceae bacterium]